MLVTTQKQFQTALTSINASLSLASKEYQRQRHICFQTFELLKIRLCPPYIIKPRTDSGRSKGVKVISSFNELQAVRGELISAADQWICQEYLADSSSEITVGVLSDCRGAAVGAILLHRTFDNILSVYDRSDSYLISSAFSQGYFKRDKAYELAAMAIAEAVDSTGPLNIQCRVKDGILYPFEINPRLSGSTYLRTLAGVNEPSLYIKHLLTGADIEYPTPREGLCLRSFTECFVEKKST